MGDMRRVIKRMCWALTASSASGCTTVHVHPLGDASVQVSSHFGFASIKLDAGRQGSVVYRTAGLGAARTLTGLTLGYWSETTALLSADGECRTVIWAEGVEQVARIEKLLRADGRSLGSVCVFNSGEGR